MTAEFVVNSKRMPKDFPREFDAHIYFSLEQKTLAEDLRKKMTGHFEGKTVFVGDLIPKPIGPHPVPMFEANFPVALFGEVVLWLMRARGELSVLVHELGGDDYRDHTQGALWLGAAVTLNLN